MGLRERLRAAQAAREGTAATGGTTIDLTGNEPGESAPAAPAKKAIWGRPTRCPACDSPGYLDRIDLVTRVMFQHCPNCRQRWETPESETIRATGV